jgi:hypothetical protein
MFWIDACWHCFVWIDFVPQDAANLNFQHRLKVELITEGRCIMPFAELMMMLGVIGDMLGNRC